MERHFDIIIYIFKDKMTVLRRCQEFFLSGGEFLDVSFCPCFLGGWDDCLFRVLIVKLLEVSFGIYFVISNTERRD